MHDDVTTKRRGLRGGGRLGRDGATDGPGCFVDCGLLFTPFFLFGFIDKTPISYSQVRLCLCLCCPVDSPRRRARGFKVRGVEPGSTAVVPVRPVYLSSRSMLALHLEARRAERRRYPDLECMWAESGRISALVSCLAASWLQRSRCTSYWDGFETEALRRSILACGVASWRGLMCRGEREILVYK